MAVMAILSRLAKIGLPVIAVAAAGNALLGGSFSQDRHILRAAAADFSSSSSSSSSASASSFQSGSEMFPRGKWNRDWDSRDPLSLVDMREFDGADEEKRKEMLKQKQPTATRNIFMIRHGQYHMKTLEKNLTPLGREQAVLVGKRLAQSGLKFDRLVMSTMPRATETAGLILDQLPPVQKFTDPLLEEGAPYPPEPESSNWRPKQKKFFADGSRIEAAFRRYIHRASPKQKEDSYEIIVCHANVIRYFVCRALQFPPEGWLRMSLGNGSITWFVIRPNGNVSIRSLGDIGHLPPDKVTFS